MHLINRIVAEEIVKKDDKKFLLRAHVKVGDLGILLQKAAHAKVLTYDYPNC